MADRFPKNGEWAIFTKDDIGYFRKFTEEDGRYILHPLTGHGRPTAYRRLNQVECIGTYVGVATIKEKKPVRYDIESIDDIYKYEDEIIAACNKYL